MTAIRIALAIAGALLFACGSAAPRAEAPELAPSPYTAAEIHAGNPVGRWRTYRTTEADGAPTLERTTFVESTEDRATFESVLVDEAGAPIGETTRGGGSWEEFRSHAAYPAAATTIDDEEIEVPAGRFACRRYEVVERTPEGVRTTRAWFAIDRSIAGPPIRHEVELDGRAISRMELVAIGPPG